MSNKIILGLLAICIFIGIVMFINQKFTPNNNEEKMKSDAEEIMKLASYKYYQDLISDNINITYKCYNINELGIGSSTLLGKNSKNYIGSVLVQGTSEDSRISIWLSDGKMVASGMVNNVQVFKSNEQAPIDCNMTN